MNWLQDVLDIRPVFSCDEIYWSKGLNKILAEENVAKGQDWALLVLDSLTDHFSCSWGDVSSEQSVSNDNVMRSYLSGRKGVGHLRSSYSSQSRTVIVYTDKDFHATVVMLPEEFDKYASS